MAIAPGLVRWRELAGAWGAVGDEIDAVFHDVAARYREPHRRYHTFEHVLDVADRCRGSAAVELAAWFHDVVYDPRAAAGVNERASATLAAERLRRLGAPADIVDEVVRLVELTASHQAADDDAPAQQLIAADLAILSAPPDDYDRYAASVREEYSHLGEPAWRAGRAAVLRNLLDRDDLGPAARKNLNRELASIGEAS